MPNVVKRLTSSGKPCTPNVNGIQASTGAPGFSTRNISRTTW